MLFYIAKGLQVAGLVGVGVALYRGMTGSIVQELAVAAVAVALFYAGRRMEA